MKSGKIKVLFLVNDFLVGGVQKLVIDQLALLPRDKYEFVLVSLIQFGNKGTFYDRIPSDVKVYRLNFKGSMSLGEWWKLIKIIKKERPDIVKSALFFSNMVARLLKLFLGFKVIAAEHNTEERRQFRYIFMNWLLSPLASTIVADSKTVADFVSKTEHIPRKYFTVIYNGVELEEIERAKKEFEAKRSDIRREIGVDPNETVFLNVARLSTQKNHKLMIEAFAEFIKIGNKGVLVIIGDGGLRAGLEEQLRQEKLQGRVILLGERTDIYKFYTASDAFLLTSLREGFCIAAMNALAFGIPVISTKVAGLVEYIKDGENGFLRNHNKSELAEAMEKFVNLSPDEKLKVKENALLTAQDFSTAKYAETYDKLYTKICIGDSQRKQTNL